MDDGCSKTTMNEPSRKVVNDIPRHPVNVRQTEITELYVSSDRVRCNISNIVSNDAVVEMMWNLHDQVMRQPVPKEQRKGIINSDSGWFGVVSKDLLNGFRIRYCEKYLIETNVTKTDIDITVGILGTPDRIVRIHVSNSGVYVDSISDSSNIDVRIEDVVATADVLSVFPLIHQMVLFGLATKTDVRKPPNFRMERYRDGFTQAF